MTRMRGWAAAALMVCLIVGAGAIGCGGETDETGPGGDPCGQGFCAETEYCCHPECGLCVEQGVACPASCNAAE